MTPYYEDDHCTIYHGDALNIIESLQFDVIVTDPPYGIAWSRSTNLARGSSSHSGIANDEDTSCRDAVLALADDVPAVVFGSFYAPFPSRVRQVCVWQKPADAGVVGSTTGHRRDAEPIFLLGPWPMTKVHRSSVYQSGGSIRWVCGPTGHPHAKPVDLMRELISIAPSGVILDPFMGSGSTLRAAKDLGRKAVGIELEERYCEIAVKRLGQEVLAFG